jgi:hypothetical protein
MKENLQKAIVKEGTHPQRLTSDLVGLTLPKSDMLTIYAIFQG